VVISWLFALADLVEPVAKPYINVWPYFLQTLYKAAIFNAAAAYQWRQLDLVTERFHAAGQKR
jgi:hypothetical protein